MYGICNRQKARDLCFNSLASYLFSIHDAGIAPC